MNDVPLYKKIQQLKKKLIIKNRNKIFKFLENAN